MRHGSLDNAFAHASDEWLTFLVLVLYLLVWLAGVLNPPGACVGSLVVEVVEQLSISPHTRICVRL